MTALPRLAILLVLFSCALPACDGIDVFAETEEPERGENAIAAPLAEAPDPGVSAVLESITDGDTFRARVGGTRERIRLIGIDTPETEHSPRGAQPFNEEATAALRGLIEGKSITLRFDVERRDRYGRMLAYVYADGRFVNAELVRLGWARPLTIAPNVAHADEFAALAADARQGRRGIWAR